jgi:hypothetical protein
MTTDQYEGASPLFGNSAAQSLVKIKFRNRAGERQPRRISLLDAVALADDLEKIRYEAIAKGWL